MAASITLAGESLKAQKQGAHEVLEISHFVLALIPELDPNSPVDRSAGLPPAAQIVGTWAYTQKGFVDPNRVVYSLMLGSDIGDFDWNWIGLQTAEGVLFDTQIMANPANVAQLRETAAEAVLPYVDGSTPPRESAPSTR